MELDKDQLKALLDAERRKNEITKHVSLELSKISPLKVKLDNILSLLETHFNLKHTLLALPDKQKTKLKVIASRGFDGREIHAEIGFNQGVIGVVASKKKQMRLSRLSQYKKYVRASVGQPPQKKKVDFFTGLPDSESQVALPLIANNELVAVLSAESKNLNFFSYSDEEFLMTLSQQIALSIQNSIVFEELEDRVKERTQELLKLNLTKDRLFSIIGHDLRSPIASLQDISELLQYYYEKKETNKILSLGEKIGTTSKNINHLLENLLSWSMNQKSEIKYTPELFSPKEMWQKVVEMFSNQLQKKQLSVNSNLSGTILLKADYQMCFSIFRNILSNAIKYSHAESCILLKHSLTDGFHCFSLKDNGVGIDEDRIKKLFSFEEKVNTPGTEREKGTGLGLVLVKELTEIQHGKLNIESYPGAGTTIHIYLPE